MYGYYTVTGTAVGSLASGTTLYPDDKLNSIIKRMVGGNTYILFNSISDVDNFCTKYNHDNNYNGLNIGDTIRINDGTYNVDWVIAGFDCEHNRIASDGTTYNNGYGICLIPKTDLGVTMKWNNSNTLIGAYMGSTMHTSHLVTVANNLKNVLGNHLVLRNVLLSSEYDPNAAHSTDSLKGASSNYTWTTSYATLMSVGQLTGAFEQHWNKYDDGEANYKLPLFNYEDYWTVSYYWLRNVWGYGGGHVSWHVDSLGNIKGTSLVTNTHSIRSLIYLR